MQCNYILIIPGINRLSAGLQVIRCSIVPTEIHDIIYNFHIVRFWGQDGQRSKAYRAVHLNTKHKYMNTVKYRYITIEYDMILKTARKGRKSKSRDSKKTPHTRPFRESHGVSPLSSLQKISSTGACYILVTVGECTVALKIILPCSITQTPTGQSKVWWWHALKMVVIYFKRI